LSGERLQEIYDPVHFLLVESASELGRTHDRNRLLKRRGGAVVEVGGRLGDIPQWGDAENVLIGFFSRHRSPADVFTALGVREARESLSAQEHPVVAPRAACAGEQLEPLLLRLRERISFAIEVPVKRRARRDERPLEGGDGPREVVEGERVLV